MYYLLFRTTWHVIPYLVSNWIVNMNIEIIIPDSLSPDLNVLVQFCAKIAFAIFSFEMIDNKRRVNKLSNTVSSTSSGRLGASRILSSSADYWEYKHETIGQKWKNDLDFSVLNLCNCQRKLQTTPKSHKKLWLPQEFFSSLSKSNFCIAPQLCYVQDTGHFLRSGPKNVWLFYNNHQHSSTPRYVSMPIGF